jgi:predicted transcriptional regulator
MAMKPPCEVIVSKVLPNIRAGIVKILIEEYKMKQIEISKILGISQSAISQYYTSSRASDKSLLAVFPEIMEYSKDVADKIANGEINSDDITLCEPCQIIRKNQKFDEFQEDFFSLMKCKICEPTDND